MKAVALADDVPELVTELRPTQHAYPVEARILSAKKTPDELAKLVKQIEISARTKLADLRGALRDESDRRQLFLALFPDGLTFAPDRTPDGKRHIWRITGDIDLGSLIDPTGTRIITTPRPANDSAKPSEGRRLSKKCRDPKEYASLPNPKAPNKSAGYAD